MSSALVRDDLGGLAVRRFSSAADAAAIDRELVEVPEVSCHGADERAARPYPRSLGVMRSRRALWTPAKLAEKLGKSRQAVSELCRKGVIPAVDHGAGSQKARWVIAAETVDEIVSYGLRRMAMRARGNF